ncbi:bifunctional (p)ppGpp synthetase/guanosine-3',5'-bis(diphosphate) 3'-pyrophosphohydrolase [Reyranella sp. MMS21-HV4-11]|jgi:GTP pyrophosphokinase|uniref:GTP pyrophosphokinase rsh n=1 Tax=Reyranella humidisoli TaxID=2849149 RepID=A0ABS6IQP1_9HYPH|nr:bifunctional (p)ppGpp synthetase/guanosine-3',5'-bis(diphosphate) 3'-pyrophosphohydrolase [Reyranella sp. MMS21-HV4-11]MBU8876335.1 bifunctional (p)ppGpp synthetase/guanosine-3',5'-bis(diphosphate) 3'-pyrophosphohydrolase [Reyranella sp. MMS21-HV4-11]
MIRQFELVERVQAYDPDADEDVLNRAYVYGLKKHGNQLRASGDPYFSHPVEVAGILAEMRLDTASIVTGLLHDTLEDTDATRDEIAGMFGEDIARLVDGVTKLSRLEIQSESTKEAENLRKLVLAMSSDIRVLLVKLADRLHNMRTLHHIKEPARRRRIARETMDLYAPLASRIGMEKVKRELEELAFGELNPDGRTSVLARQGYLRERGDKLVPQIEVELVKTLKEGGLDAQVSGREKTPYSIWRKMQTKNVSFEQLADIMAFRIIVADVAQCYQALGLLHGKYQVLPQRFKDYISVPKPNGYRSLHTGVIGPLGQRIEIQIRTEEMQDQAERGVAAHWIYKQGGPSTDAPQYAWLRSLMDILDKAPNAEEFLEHTKLEMFQDQVFCFTPKGKLIALPRGATPIDFAYAVHSQVGDTCVGAKINGRMLPLRTQLSNGDQVDIITSKAQTPSPTWERFVVTGKAKAAIRRFIRTRQREQYIQLGKSLLDKAFHEEGYEVTEKGLDGVRINFKQASVDDLVATVGAGLVGAREVLTAVYPGLKQPRKGGADVVPISRARAKTGKSGEGARGGKPEDGKIAIRGLIPGMALHFARCCHPLPGDRIVGIITTGKGVTIHTIDCATLESFSEAPERWIDVGWDSANDGDGGVYTGRLKVTVANQPGSLSSLSTVIARHEGNISNLRIVNRSMDFFDMVIDIEVADVKHLADITAALRATPAINAVERARN